MTEVLHETLSIDHIAELESAGEVGQFLAPVCEAAIEESPGLQNAQIIPSNSKMHLFASMSPGMFDQGQGNGVVIISTVSWKPYQNLLDKRKSTVDVIADRLGIAPHIMTPKLLSAFSFAHELGHADDYINNKDDWHKNRVDEMMSLPVPARAPGDLSLHLKLPTGFKEWLEEKSYWQEQGINTRKELVEYQELAYRNLPTEVAADNFAVRVLAKLRQRGTI